MFITCKCLNVSIRTSRDAELADANADSLDLNPDERADPFFLEKLAIVDGLDGVSNEQPTLIQARNVGSWVVHYCYSCSTHSHAVRRENGSTLVLINTNIVMSSDEVEKLRASPNYSAIFRIIVDRDSLDNDSDVLQSPTKFAVSQLPKPLQVAAAEIQAQLEEAVQRKSAATEEKIRAFTAEQYRILEGFRETAHAEHTVLTRLICNSAETSKITNDGRATPIIESSPENVQVNDTTASIGQPVNSKSPFVVSGIITGASIRHQAATKHPAHLHMNSRKEKRDKLQVFGKEPSSYDTEAMFPLEGMDDTCASEQFQRSEDESDTDDSGHDEGIHIPRGQRGGHPTLAKSLPVTVPAFSAFVRRNIQDDDDDDQLSRDPLDPHNIRASIKALAKSVHGDTVFGDLPRPRFSTQI